MTTTMPRHDDGRPDGRYTVKLEHTGRAYPQFVARFCGEWIGAASGPADAIQLACDHAAGRNGVSLAKPVDLVKRNSKPATIVATVKLGCRPFGPIPASVMAS